MRQPHTHQQQPHLTPHAQVSTPLSRQTGTILAHVAAAFILVAAAIAPLGAAAAPVCGADVKGALAAELDKVAQLPDVEQGPILDALYEQYAYCADDPAYVTNAFLTAARTCGAKVGYAGSLFFEDMSCCGYDPQRRIFGCPVRVKQKFGFGVAPNPGSREHVLHCVADANGVMHPVGHDSVHLANSTGTPTWQFAVIATANDNLWLTQPMSGTTRQARSILSWGFAPTGCNFQPIWGNWLDYQIRLDQ